MSSPPKIKRKGLNRLFPVRLYRRFRLSRQIRVLEGEAKEAREKCEAFDIALDRFQSTGRLPVEIKDMARGRQFSKEGWEKLLWNEVESYCFIANKRKERIKKLKEQLKKLQ